MPTEHSLFHPEAYLQQLDKLVTKYNRRSRRREPQSQGVTLSAVLGQGPALCQRIASDVRRGVYRLRPLSRVDAFVDGKRRTLYRPDLLDALVLGAIAQRLTGLLESRLSDDVYGYRPRRGTQSAIQSVRGYLEAHRRAQPERRSRGVFVLQRDLSAFGESVPTHSGSTLWALLDDVTSELPHEPEAHIMRQLLARASRPEVQLPGGQTEILERGLPTGSPIQQPLCNLYLTPLDRVISAMGVGLFARFGDDMLVMEPSLDRAMACAALLEETIASLELGFNPNKLRNLYFTKPGRPLGVESVPAFRPTSHVEYLGMRISFDGRLGLKRERLRQLLVSCRRRAQNTVRLAPDAEAPGYVAQSLRRALIGDSIVSERLAKAIVEWVDDRSQLRQLDRQIALICAETLSGRRGVRAFRELRPGELRALGLPSLLELRRRRRSE